MRRKGAGVVNGNDTAKELLVPIAVASQKGWRLLSAHKGVGDLIQAPGYITLCRIRRGEFAVHFFNVQDKGYHGGDYIRSQEAAMNSYIRRIQQYR